MSKTQKQLQRAETLERLLEAALKVFSEKGFQASTVDEICREAGYSKGAFYVHFKRKEDVFFELLEQKAAEQQEMFIKACHFDGSLENCISRAFLNVMQSALADSRWSAIYPEFCAHAARNPEIGQRVAASLRKWDSLIEQMIAEGQRAGLIRPEIEPEAFSSFLVALVGGLLLQSRIDSSLVDMEKISVVLAEAFEKYLTTNCN